MTFYVQSIRIMTESSFLKYYLTPLGWAEISSDNEAITRLRIVEEAGVSHDSPPECLVECMMQLDEYFMGLRKSFTVPVKAEGTPFQERVWKALQGIPYGTVKTYGELSEIVGGRNNTRAVGSAAHYNPILILIPCHRLVGVRGNLTGFAAGIPRKEWLLRHEGYLQGDDGQMAFFS